MGKDEEHFKDHFILVLDGCIRARIRYTYVFVTVKLVFLQRNETIAQNVGRIPLSQAQVPAFLYFLIRLMFNCRITLTIFGEKMWGYI